MEPVLDAVAGAAAEAWLRLLKDDGPGAVHGFGAQARQTRACGGVQARPVMDILRLALSAGRCADAIALGRDLVWRLASTRCPNLLAMALQDLPRLAFSDGHA